MRFEFSFVFEFGMEWNMEIKDIYTTIHGNIPKTESVYFCPKKYNKFMKLSFIKYPQKIDTGLLIKLTRAYIILTRPTKNWHMAYKLKLKLKHCKLKLKPPWLLLSEIRQEMYVYHCAKWGSRLVRHLVRHGVKISQDWTKTGQTKTITLVVFN